MAPSAVAAARTAESDQQLETLLAHPLGRIRWLAGRYVIAVIGAAVLSFLAGLLTWAAESRCGGYPRGVGAAGRRSRGSCADGAGIGKGPIWLRDIREQRVLENLFSRRGRQPLPARGGDVRSRARVEVAQNARVFGADG